MIQHSNNTLGFFFDKIQESQKRCDIWLGQDLEVYVVRVLDQFKLSTDILDWTIAEAVIEATTTMTGKTKNNRLQELGNICLLQAGLFPEHTKMRGLSMEYYNDMGKICFSEIKTGEVIYDKLVLRFDEIVFVLNYFTFDVIRG